MVSVADADKCSIQHCDCCSMECVDTLVVGIVRDTDLARWSFYTKI